MNQKSSTSRRKIRYRQALYLLLFCNLLLCCISFYQSVQNEIPDSIKLFAGEKSTFSYGIPAKGMLSSQSEEEESCETISVNLNQPFTVKADSTGEYVMESRLFGLFHLKKTTVKVLDTKEVVPCGLPVGIYVKTDGMLVLDTQILNCKDGLNYEPAKNIVKAGDYILKVNGQNIKGKEELKEIVAQSKGKDIELLINRDGKQFKVSVTPVMTKEGVYKLGIWVRDDTQGLGTLTYISGKKFGALGHGISDIDTGTRMEIEGGSLYEAHILAIKKGEKGSPGELIGQVSYGDAGYLGKIEDNTGFGIYGTLSRPINGLSDQKPMQIGLKQEVKKGKACIRLILDGKSKDYEIQIEKVDGSNKNIKKGMVIKITDKRLLKETGGIVQGMSGSPILQNGKLVGAVTHVFVNDPTRGYGIFIENMLDAAG